MLRRENLKSYGSAVDHSAIWVTKLQEMEIGKPME
jgi:hypothetical protein